MGTGDSGPGFVVWLTGLSGAGKSTLANLLADHLGGLGVDCQVLDGDEVRMNLSRDLGFSREDRDTNIRRIAYVAGLLSQHGVAAIVAAISPYTEAREGAREAVKRFVEVHVDCTLDELVRRDPKGLYGRALAGGISHFTGVSDPYEAPECPEVYVDSRRDTPGKSLEIIVQRLEEMELIPRMGADL